MESWVLILICVYSVYILCLWVVYFWLDTKKPLKHLLGGILILLILVIVTPFFWIWNMTSPYETLGTIKYKTYRIPHKITPENKVALLNLGFRKVDKDKEAYTNYIVSGYKRVGDDIIFVQEDGTITVRYSGWISRKTKIIVNLIEKLPNKAPKEDKNENK